VRDYTALALFIAINVAVSALGGWVTAGSVGTWYAALLAPYAAWVSFATLLTAALWRLN
jgi:tryptophan-rich sensory protein